MSVETVLFLGLNAASLPRVVQALAAASAALPDRRPRVLTGRLDAEAVPEGLPEHLARHLDRHLAALAPGSRAVVCAASAPAHLAQTLRRPPADADPAGDLADWQAWAGALLAAADPCLLLVDADAAPAVALAAVGRALGVGFAPLPPEAAARPEPDLADLLAALLLRDQPQVTALSDRLCARALVPPAVWPPAARPAPDLRAAHAACREAADLRLRLALREAECRERGYGATTAATVALLRDQLAALQATAEAQQADLRSLRAERDGLAQRIDDLLRSTSWRLTAPLRRLRGG